MVTDSVRLELLSFFSLLDVRTACWHVAIFIFFDDDSLIASAWGDRLNAFSLPRRPLCQNSPNKKILVRPYLFINVSSTGDTYVSYTLGESSLKWRDERQVPHLQLREDPTLARQSCLLSSRVAMIAGLFGTHGRWVGTTTHVFWGRS